MGGLCQNETMELHEGIKTGKVKGFSVEGFFYNNLLTIK
jgi:hypothetical protein